LSGSGFYYFLHVELKLLDIRFKDRLFWLRDVKRVFSPVAGIYGFQPMRERNGLKVMLEFKDETPRKSTLTQTGCKTLRILQDDMS
jgi:hypothetical protein